jgi:hypothetical protein
LPSPGEQAKLFEAGLRARHPAVYETAALTRREHAEMPRFALVRCDRGDVLMTSGGDLAPRRLSIDEFAGSLAAARGPEPGVTDYLPAISVLTGSSVVERLESERRLSAALRDVQRTMSGLGIVGIRLGPAEAPISALAVRGTSLAELGGGRAPPPQALVEVDPGGAGGDPLPDAFEAAARAIAEAVLGEGPPLRDDTHSVYFENRHIEGPAWA